MNFHDPPCIINVTNGSGITLHGKCILDTDDALWLITIQGKLLWVKRTQHLVITIDDYSEDDYSSLKISREFTELINILSK
jgi:hypothetical protein